MGTCLTDSLMLALPDFPMSRHSNTIRSIILEKSLLKQAPLSTPVEESIKCSLTYNSQMPQLPYMVHNKSNNIKAGYLWSKKL